MNGTARRRLHASASPSEPVGSDKRSARRQKLARGSAAALVGSALGLVALRLLWVSWPVPLGLHTSCAEIPYAEIESRVPQSGEHAAEFRILQITDLHLSQSDKRTCKDSERISSQESGIGGLRGADRERLHCPDELSMRALEALARAEDPDLVVFTGDTLFGSQCRDPRELLRQLGRAMYSMGVRWTVLFGNHDSEGSSASKATLALIERTYETAVRKLVPPYHHLVRVFGPAAESDVMLHLLDVSDDGGWLSSVVSIGDHTEEVAEWVRFAGACARSGRLAEAKHPFDESAPSRPSRGGPPRSFADGSPAPAPVPPPAANITMMHLPLLEYRDACTAAGAKCTGKQGEEPCPAYRFRGLYGALVAELSPVLVAAGHDHHNDWCAPGPPAGEAPGRPPPLLCYGRSTGFDSYGREKFLSWLHGARVIDLTWSKAAGGRPPVRVCTWKRLVDGSVVDRQCI